MRVGKERDQRSLGSWEGDPQLGLVWGMVFPAPKPRGLAGISHASHTPQFRGQKAPCWGPFPSL